MADCKLLYMNREPVVYVMPNAMYKMRYYIDNSENEIGWLGYVTKDGSDYIIEDVFLLKQEVHASTTEILPDALAELAVELLKTEEGKEKYNKLRMWGHSHVNMSTVPSGQDNSQMEEFDTTDFFIRLIGNKKGEWNVSIYDYTNNVIWYNLDLRYYFEININDDELKQELKDKVTKKEYVKTFPSYYEGGIWKTTQDTQEKKEKKEKIIEPYEIEGYPTKADFRNIKRYICSDEGELYYATMSTEEELEQTVFELYGAHLKKQDVKALKKELTDIYLDRYSVSSYMKGGYYE